MNGGRFPAKAVVGEHVKVQATIWREGHDAVAASVMWRGPGDLSDTEIRMQCVEEGDDLWQAASQVRTPFGWLKRDTSTGRFLNKKTDSQPFKGVRREK